MFRRKIGVEHFGYYITFYSAAVVDDVDENTLLILLGDNVNDQTMLENAGLGVAMANSAPYIQQMANIVTESNNEDGIAKVIEKYILE